MTYYSLHPYFKMKLILCQSVNQKSLYIIEGKSQNHSLLTDFDFYFLLFLIHLQY